LDLKTAFAYSANAAFARLADEMGGDAFIEYGRRMGFSDPEYAQRFPLELPAARPVLANDVESLRTNNVLRASDGFGQGELLTTPINMALVVEAVLNGGSVPAPYLVQTVRDPSGKPLREQPNQHVTSGLMSAEAARQTKAIMVNLVQTMLGGEAWTGVPGMVVGLKTGTAQLGGDALPHGWMIGFAERNGRSVVIVVVLENGGGAQVAMPVFQQIARNAGEGYLSGK
jgi:peptidoglycan glycosyltransferase